jgi:hypothetical protein
MKVLLTHLKRWYAVLKPKLTISTPLVIINILLAFFAKTPIFAFANLMITLIHLMFLSQTFHLKEEKAFRVAIHQNSASLIPYFLAFCLIPLALFSPNLIILSITNPTFALCEALAIFIAPYFLKNI